MLAGVRAACACVRVGARAAAARVSGARVRPRTVLSLAAPQRALATTSAALRASRSPDAHGDADAAADAHAQQHAQQHASESYANDGAADEAHADEQLRVLILDAALGNVERFGWTARAVSEAAREHLGLSAMSHGLLDDAASALVAHFVRKCNSELATRVDEVAMRAPAGADHAATATPRSPSPRQMLAVAIKTRLAMIAPYARTWPQAMALFVHADRVAAGARLCAETADAIVTCAGDTSSDLTWYVKRGLVMPLYAAAELHMLQDVSEDYAATWDLVDRGVEQAWDVGRTVNGAREFLDFAGSIAATTLLSRDVAGLRDMLRAGVSAGERLWRAAAAGPRGPAASSNEPPGTST